MVGVSGAGGAFGRGPFGGPAGGGRGRRAPGGGANRPYDYDVTAEEMPSNGNGAGRELPRVDED